MDKKVSNKIMHNSSIPSLLIIYLFLNTITYHKIVCNIYIIYIYIIFIILVFIIYKVDNP